MSEVKHSPLPWKACWYDWAEKNYIDIKVDGDHNHPGIATLSGGYLPAREVEANSRFIVTACNSHYAQAERIKALEEGLDRLYGAADSVWGLVCNVDHGDLEQQDPKWFESFQHIRAKYFAATAEARPLLDAARALLEKP